MHLIKYNKIKFITGIKLIHALALGHHSQGVFYSKEIQVQHADLGIDCPH